jgi:hypothetical protein
VRCITKAVAACKLDKKTQRTFKPYGATSYDGRILNYKLDKSEVSIGKPSFQSVSCKTLLFISLTSSACGYCDKANRKSQAHFSCIPCGCELNADYDYSASLNTRHGRLSIRLLEQLVATAHGLVTSPAPSGRG